MIDRITIALTVRTPLHCGSGEEINPADYTVRKKTLWHYDKPRLMRRLASNDKVYQNLLKLTGHGDLITIFQYRRFLDQHVASEELIRPIPMSDAFSDFFSSRFANFQDSGDGRQYINNLNIMALTRGAFDGLPYIPGSSLKGVLRTALLNRYLDEQKTSYRKGDRKLEKDLLGTTNVQEDPFRFLSVDDLRLAEGDAFIDGVVNHKPGRKEGVPNYMELLQTGSILTGRIGIKRMELERTRQSARGPRKEFLDFLARDLAPENLSDVLREHYGQRVADFERSLQLEPPSFNGGVPIKVGRHSGGEAMGLHGYFSVSSGPGAKGKTKPHPDTLWCCAGMSLGWAELDFLPDKTKGEELEAKADERQRRVCDEAAERSRVSLQLERDAAQSQTEAEEKARQKEERQAQEAARAKAERERLESMPPLERHVHDIGRADVDNVSGYHALLQDHDGADRVRLAQALKDAYIRCGKWKKKECSKKQQGKVNEINSILSGGPS